MPISEQQLAANRENAARSTGPRTPEGKARSAQNARKHGFTATSFAVVRMEDLDDIANLLADLVAVYQPINSQEHFALERIALAQQSLLRVARFESGLFTLAMNESLDPDDRPFKMLHRELTEGPDRQITRAQNQNYGLAEGFLRTLRDSHSMTWTLFLRYQAQTERLYRRAVEDFERLKALRPDLPPELPNEPILDDQPKENKEITDPATNPAPPPAQAPEAPEPPPAAAPTANPPHLDTPAPQPPPPSSLGEVPQPPVAPSRRRAPSKN